LSLDSGPLCHLPPCASVVPLLISRRKPCFSQWLYYSYHQNNLKNISYLLYRY